MINHIPVLSQVAYAVKTVCSDTGLRDYQLKLYNDIQNEWCSGHRNVLAVMPTGAGKCLAKGTGVLMFDGSILPVEQVKTGDLLMGPDSTHRRVLTIARGREMMYRVTPTKGDSYVVNESHILSLKQTGIKSNPKYPCHNGKGDIVNIPVLDYIKSSKTFKHTHKGWRSGVEWDDKKHDENLPPYMLGLWLGDGYSKSSTITTADKEIVDYINDYAKSRGFNVNKKDMIDNASSNYGISNSHKPNSMHRSLRSLGLLHNKHVPLIYKTGSRRQRLELLAGLLDSDGHYDGKSYDAVFKLEVLASDLAYVARSLGFAAYIKPCRKICTNNGVTGDYYRVSISGDFTCIPTKLVRNDFKPRKQKKSVLVTGLKVEPIGVDDYYGFEIDGDHLFMLGDFTVTHNTRVLSAIVKDHVGSSCTIAHRQELVSQISIAFARNGVRHRIIGPNKLIRSIVQMHMVEVGTSFYDPNARAAVAGVDTVMSWCGTGVDGDMYVQDAPNGIKWLYGPKRNGSWGQPVKVDAHPHGALQGKRPPKDMSDSIRRWAPNVTLWVTDEAHHLGANGGKRNKWMKATDLFINAKGLGVTATPCRADGAGLGADNDGVFHSMVIGPTMRWLIDNKFLTEYRIFAPPSDLSNRMGAVKISASTGDYNINQVRDAVEHSSLVEVDEKSNRVVGDVVQTYHDKFKNMLSVVFVPSVTSAEELERQFIESGVPAKSLNGNTPDEVRVSSIRKFARRELLVLINVALFDEGFDLPAIEVVQDAYPTQSYGLFCQRFGRMLRLMDGKKYGIYSDHAGNVTRHGLPDAKREWSLERREKRGGVDGDITPIRACVDHKVNGVVTAQGCYSAFERFLKVCPFCGLEIQPPTPTERSGPEFVDGDLYELDEETLAKMRGEVAKVDRPMDEAIAEYRADLMRRHTPTIGVMAHAKRFAAKFEKQQTAIGALREVMALLGGHHRAAGRDDSEIFRRFYLRYGVDWLSAQALDADAALTLGERVANDIGSIE